MYYTVVILSLERFKSVFENSYYHIAESLGMSESNAIEEKEYAYDWIVTNTVMNYVQNRTSTRVYNHYRQDLYRCMYDIFDQDLTVDISRQMANAKIDFHNTAMIKVMVTGHSVFISKGYLE